MNSYDVEQMKQIAYLMAMTVTATARIEGMKAENQQRIHRGESLAYMDEDFERVVNECGIHHNAACGTLAV